MASVGSLVVDLIAQTASFNSNIEKAAAALNSNAAKMNKSLQQIEHGFESLKEAGKVFAEAFALEKVGEAIKSGLEYAASLGVASKQLGVTTHDLQVYRFEASQVGVSQEEMDKGLQKLSKSLGQAKLGAEAPSKAFAALSKVIGEDIVSHSKSAGDAIPLVTKAFEKVTDPTKRAAVEVALFGKAGQELGPLLGAGHEKIDELAASFKNLNIELTPEQIEHAHEAEVAYGNLSRVLQAKFAGIVADNANAILNFANQLLNLAGILERHPILTGAIGGAALGVPLGPVGIIGGAIGGAAVGSRAGETLADSNQDVKFRKQQFDDARAALKSFGSGRGVSLPPGLDLKSARQLLQNNFVKQGNLLKAALSGGLQEAVPVSGGGLGSFLSPTGHSKLEPKLFADQNAKLDEQLLRIKQQEATDTNTIADFARQQINVEADKFAQDVKINVAAGHLTDAQGKQLLAKNETVRTEELLHAEMERQHQLALDAVELSTAANDNERDILQSLGAIAKTAAERQAIALHVLALDQQDERMKLNAIIADQLASEVEKKKARDRLAKLDEIYADRAKAIQIQNAGPLQNYLDALPKTIAQIAEAMQNLRVNQFEALNQRTKQFADDFSDAFGRAAQDILDLKNPLDVLKNLVSDLAHQFQQEFIVGPLTRKIHDAIGAPLAEKLVTDKIGGQTVHGVASDIGLNAQQMSIAMKTSTSDLLAFSQAIERATGAALGGGLPGIGNLGSGGLLGGNDILSGGTSGPLIGLDGQPTGAGMTSLVDMDKLKAANDSLDLLGTSSDRAAAAMAAQVPVLGQFGSGLMQVLSSLSGGGGGGGFLGGLLKLGGSLLGGLGGAPDISGIASVGLSADFLKAGSTSLTEGIPIATLPGFASGGRPRGLSLVGEKGPELFMPDAPGTIIPAGSTASFMRSIGNLKPANDRRLGDIHVHFHGQVDERTARVSGRQAAISAQREQAKAARAGY